MMHVHDISRHSTPRGVVFDIKRYAIHDGPGIRTTVFLKGCPLRCRWCQNPESWREEPEPLFRAGRCLACGACVAACPRDAIHLDSSSLIRDQERCLRCGECARACPSLAREFSGRYWTPEALLEEIVRDRVFFEDSGGGVTFSGGEPLAQLDFLEAILRRCRRERIHTAIDTSLFVEREELAPLLPLIDLYLVDLKIFDAEQHREWTGVPNERILANLQYLDREGAAIFLRIPLVEGFNADRESFQQMLAFIETLSGVRRVDLLPYHAGGEAKMRRMDSVPQTGNPVSPARMRSPDETTLNQYRALLAEKGFRVSIGG